MTHPAERKHEDTQYVDARRIVVIGGAITTLVAVTLVVMWVLLGRLERRQATRRPPAHALTAGARQAPAPRLQDDPLRDLDALRAREDAQLHAWGWVDRAAGRVHMPIERAMALLAEREAARRGEGGQ